MTHQIFDTVGSTNFTVPSGVTEMWWTAQGGGGGGGGGTSAAAPNGTGGVGGGAVEHLTRWRIHVEPDATLTVHVGDGGAGGAVGQLGSKGEQTYIAGTLLPVPVAKGGTMGNMGTGDGWGMFTNKSPVNATQADGDPTTISAGPWVDYLPKDNVANTRAGNTGPHSTSLNKMFSGSGAGRPADSTYQQAGRSRTFVGLANVEGGSGLGGSAGGCSPIGDGGVGGNEGSAGNGPASGHYGGGGGGGGRGRE